MSKKDNGINRRKFLQGAGAAAGLTAAGFPAIAQQRTKLRVGYVNTLAVNGQKFMFLLSPHGKSNKVIIGLPIEAGPSRVTVMSPIHVCVISMFTLMSPMVYPPVIVNGTVASEFGTVAIILFEKSVATKVWSQDNVPVSNE